MTELNEANEQLFDDDITATTHSPSGIEDEDSHNNGKIIDPFDPTLIRIETKIMTIDLLLTRIKHKELELTPGFQRKGGIWSDGAQSRLIESTLIRIPLPAFYIDATDDEKWLMVDGQQRLTALKRFVLDKEFALQELEFLTQLEGKEYSALPRSYQRRIVETQITVYLIDEGTPAEVKFNIFKRINTGGLPLSPQEIRHALNQGKATELLARLADSKEFKQATDYTINDDRMEDREYVLRFFAFTLFPYTNYVGGERFDSFLNNTMHAINTLPDREITNLERQFFRAMNIVYNLLVKDTLFLYSAGSLIPLNNALFESMSINLSQLDDDQLRLLNERKNLLRSKINNSSLMNDNFDGRLLEYGIDKNHYDSYKMRRVLSIIKQLIKEVLA